MSLPVDKPYFYLNQSEFKMLPRGSYVKNLNVRIVMRNPRIAFETNASTTKLATLNQNKFACIAQSLNKYTRGINTKLNFSSQKFGMIPIQCGIINADFHKEISKYMYGSETHEPGEIIPASYCNMPIFYNSYYCMIANKALNNTVGWPKLNEFITKLDASSVIDKTIYNYSYKPKLSYLTAPWTNKFNGLFNNGDPSTKSFGLATMQPGAMNRISILNSEKNTEKRTTSELVELNEISFNRVFKNANRYYSPIEMSQFVQPATD